MKTRILAVAAMAFLVTGCTLGPWYGNKAEYEKGEFKGIANQGDMAKYAQDRLTEKKAEMGLAKDHLAFDKLKAAPVQTEIRDGVAQGYKGLVANLSSFYRYNFKLIGPETKSFLLGPGERAGDYLVPGDYTCVVFQGSRQVGSWSFKVGPQQSTFMNEKYHWYVYTDR